MLCVAIAGLAFGQNNKVTLTSPTDGQNLVPLTVTLMWDTTGLTVDSLAVELSKSMTFDDTLHRAVLPDTAVEYSIPSGVLEYDSMYYWRVISYWSTDSMESSDVFSFTAIGIPPGQPTNMSPTSSSLDQSLMPTLTWNAVADADNYRVHVATFNNFSDTAFHAFVNAPTTSVTVNVRLESYTVYYWRVAAENQNGLGEWSNFWNFTTLVSGLRGAQPTLMLSAYPNPADEMVSLRFENKGTGNTVVRLLDVTGKEVQVLYDANPGPGNHDLVIERGNRKAGVYLLRVEENGLAHTLRVVFR